MPSIPVLLLMAAAAVAAALWTVVLARVARSVRRLGWVEEGLASPVTEPVAVVIPAHNEERVIDACAASLRAQDHAAVRFVVVLDRCTDSTATILRRHAAEDPRLTVVEVDACPPDWAGKCHAAWTGAQRALDVPGEPAAAGGTMAAASVRPEWLLFTDADTRFDPRLVRAALGCAVRRGSDLLSLLPRLTSERGFERLVQPVAAMTLLRLYPVERVDHPTRPRAFANGQFLLFRRGAYEAVGGHEAVRGDLLEDLAFARRVVESGGRVSLVASGDLLRVSMYDSYAAFRAGWRRIFIEGCRRKPWRLRKNAVHALITGVGLPAAQTGLTAWSIAALVAGAPSLWPLLALALVAIGLAAQAATLLWVYSLQGAPRSAIGAYPIGAVAVAGILFGGAADLVRRRPVRWGGRDYVLEPR